MNCPNCGNYNNGTNFCTNCGAQLINANNNINTNINNNQVGQITFVRPKKFYGMAIKFKLFIDGVQVGELANGSSVSFPIYYGAHRIEVKQHVNYGMKDIIINDYQNNITFTCTVKMGLFVNKIEIN